MKNKIFTSILLGFLILTLPYTASAESKLRCTYRGSLKNIEGNGADTFTVQITFEYDSDVSKDNLKMSSNKIITSELMCAIDPNNCNTQNNNVEKANYDISEFFEKIKKDDYNPKFNPAALSAIMLNTNGKYKIIDNNDEYTNLFVKDNYYKCPSTVEVLPQVDANGRVTSHGFFINKESSLNESSCTANKINDYYCSNEYFRSTLSLYDDGNQIEKKYDGNTFKPGSSSGSCCLYKTSNNINVYVYKITGQTGYAAQYAACAGDKCMTSNPNSSKKAQFLSPSENSKWNNYRNSMADCANMPKNIYYSHNNGNLTFSPDIGDIKAELQATEYCKSDVYESTGDSSEKDKQGSIDWGDQISKNCEGILGDELLGFISKIFRWIQIAAPIFVIIISGIEFAEAILQDDKDALKKASNKFIKRLIVAVALFFIPMILEVLLKVFNEVSGGFSSTCGIGER